MGSVRMSYDASGVGVGCSGRRSAVVWGLTGSSFGLQKCYMMRRVGRLAGGLVERESGVAQWTVI